MTRLNPQALCLPNFDGNTQPMSIGHLYFAQYLRVVTLKSPREHVGKGLTGHPRRAAWIAVGCSFVLMAPLTSVASATSLPASVSAVAVPASLSDDVDAAKAQLAASSKVVQDADDAVDAATAKMPAANQALANADAAVVTAQKAVDVANAAVDVARQAQREALAKVAVAKAAVSTQLVQVAKAQAEMDAIKEQIAALARQTYMFGDQYTELAILLDTKDPKQFAEQLVSVKRVSQRNEGLFQDMLEKQAALAATLVTLRELQAAAAAQERDAQARANEVLARAQDVIARAQDVQAARDDAEASKQAIADLIASREAKRTEALALRRQLKATYEDLQAKLLAQIGATKTSGTRRNAQEAIAWGMQYVGSGDWYAGLCLGFVDDAYSPRGDRMPTAIAQWYRAKAAGKGHPGDRNPPMGAQIFWDIPGFAPGHVAIYAGGGVVLTTSAFGGRVGLRTMDDMEAKLGTSVGWAEPYYG